MRAWRRQLQIHGRNSVQFNNTGLCFNLLIEPSPDCSWTWQVRYFPSWFYLCVRVLIILVFMHTYYREMHGNSKAFQILIFLSLRTSWIEWIIVEPCAKIKHSDWIFKLLHMYYDPSFSSSFHNLSKEDNISSNSFYPSCRIDSELFETGTQESLQDGLFGENKIKAKIIF